MSFDIRKTLKLIRAQEGLGQLGLADKLKVSRSAVANWETGQSRIGEEHLEQLQDLFPYAFEVTNDLPRVKRSKFRVKVWGSISAGDGQANAVTPDLEEAYIPSEFDRDDYGAMTVDGDSMMPFLMPSDLVIFRDWKQSKLNHVMAAELPNGDWVVKHLVYENNQFVLRSLNRSYEDIPVDGARLCGFLVGIIRDEGSQRTIVLNPNGLRPPSDFF